MDDRNAQVGWTEAQWNRVREEVLQAWQRVRVAGSFLPIYGPLPPSTAVVPSEVLKSDGSVDDRATADLVEISLSVKLSRQQILEEDLSSALLQFRRRATQLGQLEDWFIFNGTYPSIKPKPGYEAAFAEEEEAGHPGYRPELAHLNGLDLSGTPRPIAGVTQDLQLERMRQRNPGSLGLIEAPRVALMKEDEQAKQKAEQAKQKAEQAPQDRQAAQRHEQAAQRAEQAAQRARQASTETSLNYRGLMDAIVDAINSLEDNGYVAPYVCVFGRKPFQEAFNPINNGTVLPRDRIEPLIGRELLHASGIDILPHRSILYNARKEKWERRGVLLSMANESIDLALAAEAAPEFRQVDVEGRYVFSVLERFALRIKDAKAIVPLQFRWP